MLSSDRDPGALFEHFKTAPKCQPIIDLVNQYGTVENAVINSGRGYLGLIIPGVRGEAAVDTSPGSLYLQGNGRGCNRTGLHLGIFSVESAVLESAVATGLKPIVAIDAGFTRSDLYERTLDPLIVGCPKPQISPEHVWVARVYERFLELQADLACSQIDRLNRELVLHDNVPGSSKIIPSVTVPFPDVNIHTVNSKDPRLADIVAAWASTL